MEDELSATRPRRASVASWAMVTLIACAMMVGPAGLVSAQAPGCAGRVVGAILCPAGTTGTVDRAPAATVTDANGFSHGTETQALRCTRASGATVADYDAEFTVVWLALWLMPTALLTAVAMLRPRRSR